MAPASSRPSPRAADLPAVAQTRLVAYTDGGCRKNPGGVGGWGFLLVDTRTGAALEARGGAPETTNNRMEIQAALEVLQALKAPGQELELRTDSVYLRNMASRWIEGWKRRGWRRKDGEPVANLELVQALDRLQALHRVTWTWVPGHAGEPGNERADRLASAAMDAIAAGRDAGLVVRHAVSPVTIPTL